MRHDEPNTVKPALTGLSATLIDIARPSLVGPMSMAQAQAFAKKRDAPLSLAQSIENALAAMSNAAARIREQDRRIALLEGTLARMVKAHEECQSDSEGHYPLPDSGCIECTLGTVPNHLRTAPCAYHAAKDLLR